MAQSQNTVPTKTTGDQLTAAELNDIASVQNLNSTDSETRLQTGETHAANTSNPHSVTKTQVGLGNVEDAAASAIYQVKVVNVTQAEYDALTPDAETLYNITDA